MATDVAPVNVWPEVDGRRVANVVSPLAIIDATSSSGGRVSIGTFTTSAVGWLTLSTEGVRFSLQDSSSAGAATTASITNRAVVYGGTT